VIGIGIHHRIAVNAADGPYHWYSP
jgi:hypothetical protein